MSQSFSSLLLLGADDLSSVTKGFNKWYVIGTFCYFGSIYVSNSKYEKQQRTNILVERGTIVFLGGQKWGILLLFRA